MNDTTFSVQKIYVLNVCFAPPLTPFLHPSFFQPPPVGFLFACPRDASEMAGSNLNENAATKNAKFQAGSPGAESGAAYFSRSCLGAIGLYCLRITRRHTKCFSGDRQSNLLTPQIRPSA